jgi:hypothetical protein
MWMRIFSVDPDVTARFIQIRGAAITRESGLVTDVQACCHWSDT